MSSSQFPGDRHHEGARFLFKAAQPDGSGGEFIDFGWGMRTTFLEDNQFSPAEVVLAATRTEQNPRGGINLIGADIPGTPLGEMVTELACELLSDEQTSARVAKALGSVVRQRQQDRANRHLSIAA